MKFFRKLSDKIFAAISLVTLVLLLAVSFFAFHFTKVALRQSIMASQLEMARQSIDKIDRLLNERCSDIQILAGIKSFEIFLAHPAGEDSGVLEKKASKRMAEVVVLTGPWDLLLVTDKEGKIILASDEEEVGKSIKKYLPGTLAYERARHENLYYSDLIISERTGQSTVILAAPVRNTNAPGQPVIGTVIGYFSWPAVIQILEDISQPAALFNHEGMMIGANAEFLGANPSLKQIANSSLLRKLKNNVPDSMILSTIGETSHQEVLTSLGPQMGYLSYRGSRWGLILEQPSKLAFARATKSALRLVIFLVPIIIFTSIPFLVLILRWVVRPIAALTQATQEIAAGNLSKKVPVMSQDEMGELAVSFNTMTEKLKQSHEHLERQVHARTGELLKANKALQQSEKMSAVGQLAAGVAHEINNPLGVILGFSQGIVRRIQPGDPFEMPLKSIEREAVRCKKLVQDLLTFSRVNRTERELMDMNQAIEGALSLVQAQSKVKNVELTRSFDETLPRIFAHSGQIQQVIVNLCNNAIDAMPKGGKVTVRTQKELSEGKECLKIAIEDTGEGIPPEVQPKIFDPFFTTKEVGKGTGLGLSLVYEIIQKHNGKIQVESEVGKGTTFHILLPMEA